MLTILGTTWCPSLDYRPTWINPTEPQFQHSSCCTWCSCSSTPLRWRSWSPTPSLSCSKRGRGAGEKEKQRPMPRGSFSRALTALVMCCYQRNHIVIKSFHVGSVFHLDVVIKGCIRSYRGVTQRNTGSFRGIHSHLEEYRVIQKHSHRESYKVILCHT